MGAGSALGGQACQAGAGLPLLAARTPPSLINSHFPSLEPPGGAISLYLKPRQASYLIYRLQGRVAPGWLLGYLLNGNQGGEISHRSCQPSAKCCCFCLEQPGRLWQGGRPRLGEDWTSLASSSSGGIGTVLFCRNLFTFHFLSSSSFFLFCFTYEIPSVASDYKPSAGFHNSIYCQCI